MYAQSLIFLRFACYVHNPDCIYTIASKPILNWLQAIQEQDPDWGYRLMSSGETSRTVVSINVPSTLHHALNEIEAEYFYTNLNSTTIRTILTAKKNTLKFTSGNLRTLCKITKTSPFHLAGALESYCSRIEANPTQPVDRHEVQAIKDLGVEWTLAARLPRLEHGNFDPVYIVDEHHRVKCL